jgi:hypothetical protein
MARQFVVQLENRPGELAHLTRALAASRIDIRNIASVTAGSLASAFIATSDDDATREVLRGLGHAFIEGDMIVADVADQPGGFADAAEKLAGAGVNILGALVVGRRPGIIEVAFSVDNEAAAKAALGLAGRSGLPR